MSKFIEILRIEGMKFYKKIEDEIGQFFETFEVKLYMLLQINND